MTTGKPIRAFDLIGKMRELLELESNIMTAIYGIDIKAKKAAKKKKASATAQKNARPDQGIAYRVEPQQSGFKSLMVGNYSQSIEGTDMAALREKSLE
mmetsp:Transcript_34894/g.45945  ORF Transcript_34894/g.45945 Transcript_34894/m.45945 type:complete len:98 (+) Transcript_34894:1041-1334(+)